MTIHINPSRVNIPTGHTGAAPQRRSGQPSRHVVPRRAQPGVIPPPESLATLIRGAVAALREGVTWDRGTIVNIVV